MIEIQDILDDKESVSNDETEDGTFHNKPSTAALEQKRPSHFS